MTDATEAKNVQFQPLGVVKFSLNSTQDEYFEGTIVQDNDGNGEVVSADNSTDGTIQGIVTGGDYINSTSSKDATLKVNIMPGIVRTYTLSSYDSDDIGKALYASDDNTLTTDETAGKFFGWIIVDKDGDIACLFPGLLGQQLFYGVGGNIYIQETQIPAEFVDATDYNIPFEIPQNMLLDTVDIYNVTALDGSADVTFGAKIGTGTEIATAQVNTATATNKETIALGDEEATTGQVLNVYAKTVSSAPTAGVFLIRLKGRYLSKNS